jgi:hypothetical protein
MQARLPEAARPPLRRPRNRSSRDRDRGGDGPPALTPAPGTPDPGVPGALAFSLTARAPVPGRGCASTSRAARLTYRCRAGRERGETPGRPRRVSSLHEPAGGRRGELASRRKEFRRATFIIQLRSHLDATACAHGCHRSGGGMIPKAQALAAERSSMFEFAIFPDDSACPSAIFADLEDAIDFGVQRYGADRFSIRHCPAVVTEPEIADAAPRRASRGRA